MNNFNTDDNPIFVFDQEGLDALPVGTIVRETKDGDPFDGICTKRDRTFIYSNSHSSYTYPVAPLLPARIENPEILGHFFSFKIGDRVTQSYVPANTDGTSLFRGIGTVIRYKEHIVCVEMDESGMTGGFDEENLHLVPAIQVGDTVEIVSTNSFTAKFMGHRGTVVRTENAQGDLYIKPLQERPDGYNFSPYNWSAKDVRVVPESELALAIGDRVVVNESAVFQTYVGIRGTVTSNPLSDGDIRVVLDDNIDTKGFYRKSLTKLTQAEVDAEVEAEEQRVEAERIAAEAKKKAEEDEREAVLDRLATKSMVLRSHSPNGTIGYTKLCDGTWVRFNTLSRRDSIRVEAYDEEGLRSAARSGQVTVLHAA